MSSYEGSCAKCDANWRTSGYDFPCPFCRIDELERNLAVVASDWKNVRIEADTLRQHLTTAEGVIATMQAQRDALLEALLNLRDRIIRDVPDGYSQPCVDEAAEECDRIIDSAIGAAKGGSHEWVAEMEAFETILTGFATNIGFMIERHGDSAAELDFALGQWAVNLRAWLEEYKRFCAARNPQVKR